MTTDLEILLEKKPFSSEVDEKSFYYYPALKQRLELLIRLYRCESSIIVILGDKGSGKTLLVQQFLALDLCGWKKCLIHPQGRKKEQAGGGTVKSDKFKAFINRSGSLPVILADDVHKLELPAMLFLIGMTGKNAPGKAIGQLILFGEPSVLQKLSQLKEHLPENQSVEKIYMPSLSHRETGEYISRKICSAGYTGTPPLTVPEINRIFQDSGGLPGKIDLYAAEALDKKIRKKNRVKSFFRNIVNSSG